MAVLKGPIWSNYHRLNLSKQATSGIQAGLDARRATIFFRRLRAGNLPLLDFVNKDPDVPAQPEIETWRRTQQRPDIPDSSPNVGINSFTVPNGETVSDYVAIIDVDAQGPNQGYEVIKLPFIPREVEINTESTFASIRPMGSNTARYHYTGAEDKIEFEIDWYSFDSSREDVIRSCRRIESLSKADGYSGSPHKVLIKWGDADVLFAGQYFVVLSATYKLSNFSKAHMLNGGIKRDNLLPTQAFQKVVLGRISSTNLTTKQIEFVKKVS